MALMKFREPNQVRWQGVRPGHNGTQVFGHNNQGGIGMSVVYTVTAGKTLYLCYAQMSANNTAAAVVLGEMRIRDPTPAFWWGIFRCIFQAAGRGDYVSNFWPPVEIPALHTIEIRSDNAGVNVQGSIMGWEE